MKPEDIYHLSLAAVGCALLGTVLLAFALSRWMSAISLSLTALEEFKDTYLAGGDVLSITGTKKHRAAAAINAQCLTYAGLFLVIAASVFQLIALCNANPTTP